MTRCHNEIRIKTSSQQRMHITHVGVNDGILSTQEEHCLLGIFGVGNLLVPQGIRRPIEVPLEEIRHTKLHTNEVLDDKI